MGGTKEQSAPVFPLKKNFFGWGVGGDLPAECKVYEISGERSIFSVCSIAGSSDAAFCCHHCSNSSSTCSHLDDAWCVGI